MSHHRQQDLVDFFGEARQGIRELLGELRAQVATGSDRLHQLADVVVAEVSGQITLERRYLLPLADKHLAGADADELRGELAEVEELVRRLYEHSGRSAQEVAAAAEKLAERLDRRAQAQDRHLFPRLREAVDSDQLREQGQRAWAAKDGAPTRPHPRAPDRPPWSGVTDPVVGAADRVRDEVTGRPTDPNDIG